MRTWFVPPIVVPLTIVVGVAVMVLLRSTA